MHQLVGGRLRASTDPAELLSLVEAEWKPGKELKALRLGRLHAGNQLNADGEAPFLEPRRKVATDERVCPSPEEGSDPQLASCNSPRVLHHSAEIRLKGSQDTAGRQHLRNLMYCPGCRSPHPQQGVLGEHEVERPRTEGKPTAISAHRRGVGDAVARCGQSRHLPVQRDHSPAAPPLKLFGHLTPTATQVQHALAPGDVGPSQQPSPGPRQPCRLFRGQFRRRQVRPGVMSKAVFRQHGRPDRQHLTALRRRTHRHTRSRHTRRHTHRLRLPLRRSTATVP